MNLLSLRLVPQLDRSPCWIAFAQTIPGKLSLIAAFAGLLFLHETPYWWCVSLYLLAFSLWPSYRWQILIASTWSFLLITPNGFYWERINILFSEAGIKWQINSTGEGLPLIIIVILFAALCTWLVRSSPLSRYLKRPVLALICFNLGLMISASYAPLPQVVRAFLWAFIVVFGQYLWFICYSLKECRAPNPVPLPLQLGHYLPFWFPGNLPYHKGASYLTKIEAKTAEEFSICQLKGVKLLLWALWLKLFSLVLNITLYGYGELLHERLQFKRELGTIQLFLDGSYVNELTTLPFSWILPSYEVAFKRVMIGNPLPWHMNWIVIVSTFLLTILTIALTTHIVIATIRMCGFNALRNTYRPLASKTIAVFWNHLFYYYKELLVEFFFYPAFFRYFKKHPMLRKYCATMAAACLGNFLFHFMLDVWSAIDLGFFQSIVSYQSYFFYCFVLGNAIFISQIRSEKVLQHEAGLISRFFAPIRVLGFYCLLNIFAVEQRESIYDNMIFLLSLLPFQMG